MEMGGPTGMVDYNSMDEEDKATWDDLYGADKER